MSSRRLRLLTNPIRLDDGTIKKDVETYSFELIFTDDNSRDFVFRTSWFAAESRDEIEKTKDELISIMKGNFNDAR